MNLSNETTDSKMNMTDFRIFGKSLVILPPAAQKRSLLHNLSSKLSSKLSSEINDSASSSCTTSRLKKFIAMRCCSASVHTNRQNSQEGVRQKDKLMMLEGVKDVAWLVVDAQLKIV